MRLYIRLLPRTWLHGISDVSSREIMVVSWPPRLEPREQSLVPWNTLAQTESDNGAVVVGVVVPVVLTLRGVAVVGTGVVVVGPGVVAVVVPVVAVVMVVGGIGVTVPRMMTWGGCSSAQAPDNTPAVSTSAAQPTACIAPVSLDNG